MLIPSFRRAESQLFPSLSRRVNANSQRPQRYLIGADKLIKKGEC